MKKINKKDFEELQHSGGRANPILNAIKNLKVGEGIIIDKSEWKPKTHIGTMWCQYRQRYGISIKTKKLVDGKGWAVIRTQ